MRIGRARKPGLDLRALGPYLLIELLLPGGTLLAALLWLAQRLQARGIDGHRQALRQSLQAAAIAAKPYASTDGLPAESVLAPGAPCRALMEAAPLA